MWPVLISKDLSNAFRKYNESLFVAGELHRNGSDDLNVSGKLNFDDSDVFHESL